MGALIFDATVLIGFDEADWLEGIPFWRPGYNPIVAEPVWNVEFAKYRDIPANPDWIDVAEIDESLQVEDPGALSRPDWSCIILAERTGGSLVTRDRDLKNRAEKRGIDTIWASKFAIDTYVECGISEAKYRNGIEKYIDDAHLSDEIKDLLKSAEKNGGG